MEGLCPAEAAGVQPQMELFGAKIILYFSLILLSFEIFRLKHDANLRLRKLMHELLDCGMDEDFTKLLHLMEQKATTTMDASQLSKALQEVENLLLVNFPAFQVRIDKNTILSHTSMYKFEMENLDENNSTINKSTEKKIKTKALGTSVESKGKEEKKKIQSKDDITWLDDGVPVHVYWNCLYSVLHMIVHQQPGEMLHHLDCLNCEKDQHDHHREEIQHGSFDYFYFCRCQPSFEKAVHESVITCYENTIGSYFFIQKVMNGIFALLHLDIGSVFKSCYDAWQFQGEINGFIVPFTLLLSSFLVDSHGISYEQYFAGWNFSFGFTEAFSHGYVPMLVHTTSLFIVAGCYAYAYTVLVSYSWKESSIAFLLARTWPGNLVVDWIIALMVLNTLATHPDFTVRVLFIKLNRWVQQTRLGKYRKLLFLLDLAGKGISFCLQFAVIILVQVSFLSPPFELPSTIKEFGVVIGTIYWLYENVNVHWSDNIAVVERCTGSVVLCLTIIDWYKSPDALSVGEACLLYTQLYLVIDILKDSWFRKFCVADLKPDLYLLLIMQLPAFIISGRSSLIAFTLRGLQAILQFCLKPDVQQVQLVNDIYYTWIDFVILKCGGMYIVGQAGFLVYMWLLGDFDPSQLLENELAQPAPQSKSSSSRRRKKRAKSKSYVDATPGKGSLSVTSGLKSVLPAWMIGTKSENLNDSNRMVQPKSKQNASKKKRANSTMSQTPTRTHHRRTAYSVSSTTATPVADIGRPTSFSEDHHETPSFHPASPKVEAVTLQPTEKSNETQQQEVEGKTKFESELKRKKRREKQQRKKERRQERLRRLDDKSSKDQTKTETVNATEQSVVQTPLEKTQDVTDSVATDTTPKKTVRESKQICVQFLTGDCLYKGSCWKRHPPPEEVIALKERYGKIACRWGRSCTRKNCLFQHMSRVSSKPSLATIAVQKVGEAWSAAVGRSPLQTVAKKPLVKAETTEDKNETGKKVRKGVTSAWRLDSSTPEPNRRSSDQGISNSSGEETLRKLRAFSQEQDQLRNDWTTKAPQSPPTRQEMQGSIFNFVTNPIMQNRDQSHEKQSSSFFNNHQQHQMNAAQQQSQQNFVMGNFLQPKNQDHVMQGRQSFNNGTNFGVSAHQPPNSFNGMNETFQPDKMFQFPRSKAVKHTSTDSWDFQTPINFDELLDDPTDAVTISCDICKKQTEHASFSPCGHMTICQNCANREGSGGSCTVCKSPLTGMIF